MCVLVVGEEKLAYVRITSSTEILRNQKNIARIACEVEVNMVKR